MNGYVFCTAAFLLCMQIACSREADEALRRLSLQLCTGTKSVRLGAIPMRHKEIDIWCNFFKQAVAFTGDNFAEVMNAVGTSAMHCDHRSVEQTQSEWV